MTETVYRITQIEPQKHSEGRFSIYLDGAFAFGLDGEVVLRHHLHEGDEIAESMIDDVLLSEERSRAKKKALAMLSRAPRSTQELKKRLFDAEISARTVERVVMDFTRVGLLNDREYAASYARSRLLQRSIGKRLLRLELLQKGIDEETAEFAVGEAYGSASEESLARELADKKLRHSEPLDKWKLRQKLSEFLFRRGFEWDVISVIVEEKIWDSENQ